MVPSWMKSRGARWARRALALMLGLLFLEAGLWVASFLLRPEERALFRSGLDGREVILCVGDSNTFGIGLDAEESYPGQLQGMLDRAPTDEGWLVVNMGYPGTNSAEVRAGLRASLASVRPRIVILWVGVTNRWSLAQSHLWEVDGGAEEEPGLLATVVQESRTILLFRIGLDRLRSEPASPKESGDRLLPSGLAHRGDYERADVRRQGDALAASIHGDFDHIRMLCEERGARLVVANYPLDIASVRNEVNAAIESFARSREVPLVDLFTGVVPLKTKYGKDFLFRKRDTHLNEVGNYEVARLALRTLQDCGALDPRREWEELPSLEERVETLDLTVEPNGDALRMELAGPPGWYYRLQLLGRYEGLRPGDPELLIRHEGKRPPGWVGRLDEDGASTASLELMPPPGGGAAGRWRGWELIAEAFLPPGELWDHRFSHVVPVDAR